jgi:murein DD-endopeptidase MepM/ murein hydrolase activator NlpD
MRVPAERSRSPFIPHVLVLGAAGLLAAGCSSDTNRFGQDSLTNPFETSSAAPAPVASAAPASQIESRPLEPAQNYSSQPATYQQSQQPPAYRAASAAPAPRAAPAYQGATYQQASYQPAQAQPDRTGSTNTQGSWRWDGGTAITLSKSESIESISARHGVPVDAIVRANNLSPNPQLRPGQRIVIPRYVYTAAAPAAAAPKPRAEAPAPARSVATNAPSESAAKPAPVAQAKAAPAQPAPQHNQKVASLEPTGSINMVKPTETPDDDAGSSGAGFRWPVRGRVVAGFGPKPTGQQNDGINLSVPEGTPVKASDDGVVAYAGNELKGYGNLVLVRHANGFVTAYAHASEVMVKRGDKIKRGQVIAKSGQTGNVNSPQLHFEIRKGSTPVDPMQYLNGAG